MALKQGLNKGDWVRAVQIIDNETFEGGGIIEGQAYHSMGMTGSSSLTLYITDVASIELNVNFWDVTLLRRNQIPYNPPAPVYTAADM